MKPNARDPSMKVTPTLRLKVYMYIYIYIFVTYFETCGSPGQEGTNLAGSGSVDIYGPCRGCRESQRRCAGCPRLELPALRRALERFPIRVQVPIS